MTQTEALRLAWEALHQIAEVSATDYEYQQWASEAITAIKAALEADTWVGLTDEETVAIELGLRIPTGYRDAYDLSLHDFAKAIETKLKEKNNG
jgi:hypothetical protein